MKIKLNTIQYKDDTEYEGIPALVSPPTDAQVEKAVEELGLVDETELKNMLSEVLQ